MRARSEAYARSDAKSSRRTSGRPESPAGRAADWGGSSTGSRKKGSSKVPLSSMERGTKG